MRNILMLTNERVRFAVANLVSQINDSHDFDDFASLAYQSALLMHASSYLCGTPLDETVLAKLEEYCGDWGC